jgi:catechol 2,3-dioxygenase-like lactoylglutathione lyase family enzyme
MTIRRIVPNVASDRPDLCRDFYVDFLGLEAAMDLGWVATYASPTNRTAQITVVRAEESGGVQPAISVEVDDVDRVHADAVAQGRSIVYPLTDEPWGVRRFWVEDPNGVVVNILSHRDPAADSE